MLQRKAPAIDLYHVHINCSRTCLWFDIRCDMHKYGIYDIKHESLCLYRGEGNITYHTVRVNYNKS